MKMNQHLVHKLQGKEREQASIFSHLLLVNLTYSPVFEYKSASYFWFNIDNYFLPIK